MTILAQPAVPCVNLVPIQSGKIIKLCYTEILWRGGEGGPSTEERTASPVALRCVVQR